MKQTSIALINDLSGFGRCSLTVSLPIISMLKVECAVLPTCVLSTHTAYPSFYMKDLTESMDPWMDEWNRLDLHFDGIYTGFLGSEEQFEKVIRFIDLFGTSAIVIVDPVMGDRGKIYPTYTESMCHSMKQLVRKAQLITPNLTEACTLAGWIYREDFRDEELFELGRLLMEMGPEKVVISGIEDICEDRTLVKDLVLERGKEPRFVQAEKISSFRHGTGDVFASILAAEAVKGHDFYDSVVKASAFVRECLRVSDELGVDAREGVAFEEILYTLR